MSEQTIREKSQVIRNETNKYANTRERVADVLDDINDTKANKDASELSEENKRNWREVLDIYDKKSIDDELTKKLSKPTTTIFAPNMDYKYIPILNERGEMHRIPTEDLFQSVKILNNAIGDDAFTNQVVARPDGTLGVVEIKNKVKTKILQQDYTPNESLEYLDVFTANLKANTTYKLELGIIGNVNVLTQCIVTNDIGFLSIRDKYIMDNGMGIMNFHLIDEEDVIHNTHKLNSPQMANGFTSITYYIIRPKSDCYIKIPTKDFGGLGDNNKLLAGTYMRIEEIA